MLPNDEKELVRIVTDVMAYYRQPVSEFVLHVWCEACKSFTLEEISKAFTAHITDAERGVYAPKVADLVRVLQGTTTDRAALAWGKVYGAMSAVGAYSDVIFDEPAIHAAIEDNGGWIKMCRGEETEVSYLQHRFCLSYKAYVGRKDFDYQRKLMGDRSPDIEYSVKNLPLPKPAIVGDADLAMAVFNKGSTTQKTQISFNGFVDAKKLIADSLQDEAS